jgi:hypothetical protein
MMQMYFSSSNAFTYIQIDEESKESEVNEEEKTYSKDRSHKASKPENDKHHLRKPKTA